MVYRLFGVKPLPDQVLFIWQLKTVSCTNEHICRISTSWRQRRRFYSSIARLLDMQGTEFRNSFVET